LKKTIIIVQFRDCLSLPYSEGSVAIQL